MQRLHDTETHCHCGSAYEGSDHCPECGCEQYESRHCPSAKPKQEAYVLIYGKMPHTNRTLLDYVQHIVYGVPNKITVTEVEGNFVALLEYPEDQLNWAIHTFDRMGSFPYGAMIPFKREEALLQFGCWVYHYAASRSGEEIAA